MAQAERRIFLLLVPEAADDRASAAYDRLTKRFAAQGVAQEIHTLQ